MTTTWRRGVRTATGVAVLVGLVLTAGPATGASTADVPVLTKERLYELARSRTYGTPVEIEIPGARARTPRVLTDSGVVVGDAVVDGVERVFRWRDGRTELGPPPPDGWELHYAVDVNEAGTVLGSYRRPGEWDLVEPFAWYPDGTVRSLADAGTWRSVVGITGSGAVLGMLADGRAVTWRDGALTDVPLPAGAVPGSVDVVSVNERGEYVGHARGADAVRSGYVWRDDVPTRLPAPAGSGVQRITEHGDVIGTLSDTYQRVVWEDGARLRQVDPKGVFGLTLTDVNARGVVIGDASVYHLRGAVRADPARGVIAALPGLGGERRDPSWAADIHDVLDVTVGNATPVGTRYGLPVVWVSTVPVPLGSRIDGEQAWAGRALSINARGQVLGYLYTEWTDTKIGNHAVLWDLVPRR